MKNLLEKYWIGFVCLAFVALLSGIIYGMTLTKAYQTYAPQFIQETKHFLPIVIQNGEIISPKNTVIKKSYTFKDSNESLDVVLDTQVNEFQSSLAPNGGIYITKKCIYSINKSEIRAQCFNDIIDKLVIDEVFLTEISALISKYLWVGVFLILPIILLVSFYIALLFYSLIIKLVLSIWTKCLFKQVLLINSLLYSVFEILSLLNLFKNGILIRLLVFTVANILIIIHVKKEDK